MPDVAILGLGPLGAALGRAVKRAAPQTRVAGFDPDRGAGRRAAQTGAVDEAAPNVAQAVAGAQLIVLAAPLDATREALRVLGQLAPAGSVVTDTCALKTPVLRWAQESLPPAVHFVGGRPLCGDIPSLQGRKGNHPLQGDGGPHSADGEPSLEGADYCIIPGVDAPSTAVDAVIALAGAAGARPFFVDAAEHDSYVVAAELLPLIAGSAAIDAVTSAPVWRDARRFRSAAFDGAAAGAELRLDELALAVEHAPDAFRAWADRLIAEAAELRDLAAGGADAAEAARLLAERAEARRERLRPPGPEGGGAFERQSFSSLMLGDWLASRAARR